MPRRADALARHVGQADRLLSDDTDDPPIGDRRRAARDGSRSFRTAEAMSFFPVVDGELHVEGVPLRSVAEQFGTPCFVYSRAAIEGGYREFDTAFAGQSHLVCYAVKANSNLAVLNR